MTINEHAICPPLPAVWPPLDSGLLGEARPTPPAFPLHLLPGRWRAWVEASSRLFGSADYLAHYLLGSVAGWGGAGIRIGSRRTGASRCCSGRRWSAAFARVRAPLDAVESL